MVYIDDGEIARRRRRFRDLHRSGCFLIPNPWDPGSARQMESMGFEAIATTSSGFAWSQAKPDGAMPVDAVIAHLQAMVAVTSLPVNADFENGFGATPQAVHDNVLRALGTGIAALSIEDTTGDPECPIHTPAMALERFAAARAAIEANGGDALLVGRADGLLHGHGDLAAIIERLRALAAAGADCVYAPGLRTLEEIGRVVRAVAPTPLNVLVGHAAPFTLADLAAQGVRRVSVGGALARTAWAATLRTAELLRQGRFDGFAQAASGQVLNQGFTPP